MQIRILSASDVRAAIDMPTAIGAMRDAFAALAEGRASVPVRLSLETEHGVTLFMPAHVTGFPLGPSGADGGEQTPGTGDEALLEAAAAKVVSVNPGNTGRGLPMIHAVVLAIDVETGRLQALMDGTWLTALRTGAVGGLAADLMARADARVVALFGAGVQARTQLEAVRCVRDVHEVRVVSRSGASAASLAAELSGVDARPVDDPEEALAGADIVIAATSSATPVFEGALVEPGTHVTGVGSFTPDMREVDSTLVQRARVVVDQREAILEEAGDIVGPVREGVVDPSVMVAELGDLVLGRVLGRTDDDEITFFKSVGNAVQDLAVATRVLEKATRAGLGIVVEL
jgi:alanine dehydrogenase